VRKADNLQPSCAIVTKPGNPNFLEPSGPVQACNGTELPLPRCESFECLFPNILQVSKTKRKSNWMGESLESP